MYVETMLAEGFADKIVQACYKLIDSIDKNDANHDVAIFCLGAKELADYGYSRESAQIYGKLVGTARTINDPHDRAMAHGDIASSLSMTRFHNDMCGQQYVEAIDVIGKMDRSAQMNSLIEFFPYMETCRLEPSIFLYLDKLLLNTNSDPSYRKQAHLIAARVLVASNLTEKYVRRGGVDASFRRELEGLIYDAESYYRVKERTRSGKFNCGPSCY